MSGLWLREASVEFALGTQEDFTQVSVERVEDRALGLLL